MVGVAAVIAGAHSRIAATLPAKRMRGSGCATSATRFVELGDRHAAGAVRSRRRGYLIGASIAAAATMAVAAWLFLPINQWLRLADQPESRIVIDDIELESPHVAFSPDGASLVIEPRFDRPERLILRKLELDRSAVTARHRRRDLPVLVA